jgi:hypothetical protein
MKALRRPLARLLLQAHLWKLRELVLPEGSAVFLRGGGTMVFKYQGRLHVREGERIE